MFKACLAFSLSLSFSLSAMADKTAEDFARSQEYAKSLSGQTLNAFNQFNPKATFKGYNENPAEQNYYQGVETEKTDLDKEASQALDKDAGAKTVVEHFGEHKFEINENNAAIKKSQLIEEESYAITHGVSNAKVHCEEKEAICEVKAERQICYRSMQLPDKHCSKKLEVSVSKDTSQQQMSLWFTIPAKWTGVVRANLFTGAVSGGYGGSVVSPIKLNHPCGSFTTAIHSILSSGINANKIVLNGTPSCTNGGQISFFITEAAKSSYTVQVILTPVVDSLPFVTDEHWNDDCLREAESDICQKVEEHCTESASTRIIEGLSVQRNCWELEATYSCASQKTDECKSQKEKGCLQISSRCFEKKDNVCMLYEQTYNCQEKVCTPKVTCVKDLFCRDGDCTTHVSSQNHNFGQAVSSMAVAGATGNEYQRDKTSMFGGKVVRCKIWLWDFIDCCSDKGWGKKLNIAHCREEDKDLGKAKLDYLVHYLGEYCSEKDLGVCIEHKRTYCVFNTKMARIIQEEGRLKQLNPNALGTAEEPTCGGLTIEELQSIDMGKVDFIHPVYPFMDGSNNEKAGIAGDFKLNTPNAKDVTDKVSQRIQEKVKKL